MSISGQRACRLPRSVGPKCRDTIRWLVVPQSGFVPIAVRNFNGDGKRYVTFDDEIFDRWVEASKALNEAA